MPEPQNKPATDPAATQDPNAKPAAQAGAQGQQGQPATQDPKQQQQQQQQAQQQQQNVPLAALHEEREKTRALKEELDVLKQMMPGGTTGFGQQQQQFQPYQQPQPQVNQVAQQMEQLWQQDPKQAMRAEIALAFDYQNRANASVSLQEQQVTEKNPDYGNYRTEVHRYLTTLSPDQKMKPGVVQMAYYLIKGQKVDQLVAQNQTALFEKIKAGEQVQGLQGTFSAPVGAPNTENLKPTAEQVNAANAMGMPVEEYMKGMRQK